MTGPEPARETPAAWSTLDPSEKRDRVLRVAGELFAREGVEFPMPALAKTLGIGVGSLYRQVGSKDDILAELVIERLERFEAKFLELEVAFGPIEALDSAVEYTLNETLKDRVAKISFDLALDDEGVREKRASAASVLERLVEAAKAAGGLRPDATVTDLRIMFRLAREAEKLAPGGGRRIAQLVVAGLHATA